MKANRVRLIAGAATLVLGGWMTHAAAQVKGASADDSAEKLSQRIDALTARVKQLELGQANFVKSLSKPDVPDDAAESLKKAQGQGAAAGANSAPGRGDSGGQNEQSGKGAGPAEASTPHGESMLDVVRRLTALENSRHRVTAPFEVADSSGKLIFLAQDSTNGGARGAHVFDSQGHLVVSAYASAGGKVDVYNGSDTDTSARLSNGSTGPSVNIMKEHAELVTLDAYEDFGELQINAPGKPLAILRGTDDAGELIVNGSGGQATLDAKAGVFALRLGPANAPVVRVEASSTGGLVRVGKSGATDGTYATMAATKDGLGFKVKNAGAAMTYVGVSDDGMSGLVNVYGGGKPVAALQTYDGGKGQISVFNSAGLPISFLAESDKNAGGGSVTVTDPGGNGIFSAGYTGDGAGAACVDRKGATGSLQLKCLGIDLPLTMGN